MQCLKWSADHNAVCVPEIDDEHQTIFRLADELYQAVEQGSVMSSLEAVLRDLIDQTVTHFSHEERLMRSLRYPAYGWHKAQHDTVRTKLAYLGRRVEKGDREAVLPALDFVTAWLQTHTAVSDRMMGAFLRTHGLARDPGPSKSRPGKKVVEPQP
jgi:hemerythrin-like metal-binding protein